MLRLICLLATCTLVPVIFYGQHAESSTSPINIQHVDTLNNVVSKLSPSFSKDRCYFVHGNLIIDQNHSFTHCTFLFTANSKITLNPNSVLTLNNCTLKAGCAAMWDGIYADGFGSEIYINGGVLQDMENGVMIAQQGKLSADQTQFNSNFIGVQLKNLPSSYSGTIQRCNFNTPSALLPPHDAQINGEHGIRIIDCQSIIIGHTSDAGKRNDFQNLYNGINILNTRPNPLQLNPLSEVVIHCEYNTFSQIQGGAALWSNATNNGPQFYQDHRGCAIYGMNEWMPYPIKLFYKGNNSASFFDYLNCQKAILVNSFSTDIQFAKAENIDGGILQFSCEYHKQFVKNNTLNNTYMGVLVQGNTGGGYVNDNSMTLLAHPEISPSGSPLFWGKGVELHYFTNTQASTMEAMNNTISSNASDWILGLNVLNSPFGKRNENQIFFTTTSNVFNPYPYPVLRGIQIVNSNNNIFEKNTVTGMNNADALFYRRSTGVYMERNSRNTYNCNVNDYMFYGAYVLGDNAGNYDQFNNNKFRSSRYGILLRHLVNNGTLGNIGSQAIYDANNKFYDQSIGSVNNNKRIYRITSNCTPDDPLGFLNKIYTNINNIEENNITHSNSSIGYPQCAYRVLNSSAFNFTFQCIPGTIQTNEDFDEGVVNIEQAKDIAEDSIIYSEYAELGEWMDELGLYGQLERDDSVRLAHPILDSFYIIRQQTNLDKIYQIDRLIGEMSDSMVYSNPVILYEKIQEAMLLNNLLIGNEYYIENEHWVNEQYFISLQSGVESLTVEVKSLIATLASECPYLAGKAVFKARVLNSQLNPLSNYDDLQLCNNAGVYKNSGGSGLFDDENAHLDSIGSQDGLHLIYGLEKTGIKIYPNPVQEKIMIKYQLDVDESGMLIFYDLTGREHLRIQLPNTSTTVETLIPNLHDGVYVYKYLINNKVSANGKLNVIK